MMKDQKKSKAELIQELAELHKEVARLKAVEADCLELKQRKSESKQGSEEMLRTVFDSVHDAIFLHTLDGTIIDVNQKMLEMYGVDREQALASSVAEDFSSPDNPIEQLPEMWDKVISGESLLFEWEARRPQDGSTFDAEIFLTKIHLRNKDVILATVSDITKRKQLERRIRESLAQRERQIQTSTEVAQEIAAAPALNELYRQVVERVQHHFGYYHAHIYTLEEDDLVMQEGTGEAGRQLKAKGHKIPLSAEKSLVARAARTGEPVLIPDVVQEPGWLPNPLLPETKSELAVAIKLKDQVLGVLDVQDDTVGGLSEEDQLLLVGLCGQIAIAIENTRLLEEATVFRQFADASGQGFSMGNLEKKLVYLNPALARMLKLKETEEALGRPVLEFYPENRHQVMRETILPQVITEGEWQGESVLQAVDGTLIPVIQNIFLIRDKKGTPRYVANVVIDISERKEGEELLSKRAVELQAVAEMSAITSTILDPDELLQEVADLTKERFDLYHAHLYLLDETGENLNLAAGADEVGRKMMAKGWSIPFDREHSLVAKAARTRLGIIANDVRQEPDWLPNPLLPETRSELAVPMIVGDRLLGVLDVQSHFVDRFTADDVRVKSTFAAQVAVALQNARLYEQMRTALTEVQQSQYFLNTILDNIPNPVFFKDTQGVYLGCNQAFLDYLGVSEEKIIGKSVYDLSTNKALADEYHQMDQDLFDNPGTQVYEAQVKYADGTLRDVIFNKATFVDQDGKLAGLIGTMVDITERKQTERILSKLAVERTVLNEVSLAILRESEAQTIYELTTQTLVDKFGMSFARIWIVNETHNELVLQSSKGEYTHLDGAHSHISLDDKKRKLAWIARERQPYISNDVQNDPRTDDPEWAKETHTVAFVGFPLIAGDELLGVLGMFSHAPVLEETVPILQSLAVIVGSVVNTQRLFKRADTLATELAMVSEVSVQAATTLDPIQLLQTVTDLTKERFGLYHAHIYLLNEVGDTLNLVAGAGEIGQKMVAQGWSIPCNRQHSLVAQAVRTKKGIIVNDVQGEPDFMPNPLLPETRSEMAVPMIVGDAVLGVLDTQSDKINRFNEEDLLIQTTLATEIAVALQNASLYIEQQQARALLDKRLKELDCLNDIGWKIEESPEVVDFLQWVTERIPQAMQYPEDCLAAVELEGDIYGQAEAIELPRQMKNSLIDRKGDIIGYIYISYRGNYIFLNEESVLLAGIASRVGSYIEGQRLAKQARERREELEEATAFLDSIVENIPLMVMVKEAKDLTIVRWNKAGENILGFERDEVLGRNEYNFRSEKEAASLTLRDRKILSDRKLVELPEEPIQTASGSSRYLRTQKVPIYGPDDRPIYLLEISEDITERKQVEEALTKRAIELETVAEVSTAAATILDSEKLLQEVVDLTKQRFGLYHAHIYLLDKEEGMLNLVAGAGEVGRRMVKKGWRIPLAREHSLVARAARTQSGIIVNNVREDPDWLPNPLLPDTRSEMAIPMLIGEKLLGVLDVQSDQLDRFTSIDVRIKTTLASQVAIALENSRLFEEAQQTLSESEEQTRRLALLNELGAGVSQASSVDGILQAAARLIYKIVVAHWATVTLLSEENDDLLSVFSLRKAEGAIATGVKVSINDTLAGQVIKGRQLVNIPDLRDDEHFLDTHTLAQQGLNSSMNAPLLVGEKVIGTLSVANRNPSAYGIQDETLLMSVASFLGTAIENQRLYAQTHQRVQREQLINTINQKIQGTKTMESALRTAVQELGQAFRAKYTRVELNLDADKKSSNSDSNSNSNGEAK